MPYCIKAGKGTAQQSLQTPFLWPVHQASARGQRQSCHPARRSEAAAFLSANKECTFNRGQQLPLSPPVTNISSHHVCHGLGFSKPTRIRVSCPMLFCFLASEMANDTSGQGTRVALVESRFEHLTNTLLGYTSTTQDNQPPQLDVAKARKRKTIL